MIEFDSTKILVSVHKESLVPNDPLYISVCAGAEVNRGEFITDYYDDQGENISGKNPFYCELSVLYWFWKNCRAPSVGLSHYRRYFYYPSSNGTFLTRKDYSLLNDQDLILPHMRDYRFINAAEHFGSQFSRKYWSVLREAVVSVSPEMETHFRIVEGRKRLHIYNMFIMKWELFDEYMDWLFKVLERCEMSLNIQVGRTQHSRMLGHYGERLLNVWLESRLCKGDKYVQLPVNYTDRQPEIKKAAVLIGKYIAYKLGKK